MKRERLTAAKIDDAAAVAIERTAVLLQMELWLRGQARRGYVDAETFGRLIDDIYETRRRYDALRAELAELRRGE